MTRNGALRQAGEEVLSYVVGGETHPWVVAYREASREQVKGEQQKWGETQDAWNDGRDLD